MFHYLVALGFQSNICEVQLVVALVWMLWHSRNNREWELIGQTLGCYIVYLGVDIIDTHRFDVFWCWVSVYDSTSQ